MAIKMKSRNPLAGRHGAGSAIAKSGTRPPDRTGSASGNFVGTGVNAKTKSPGRYSGSQPKASADAPAEDWINQSPTPWDSSQPTSNPVTGAPQAGPSAKVGGMGGKTGAAGAMTGSAGIGRAPGAREDDMAASGHARGYQYRGLNPSNSGKVTTQAPKRNTDNGSQPNAKRGVSKDGNRFEDSLSYYKRRAKPGDFLVDAYESYKRHGG